MNDIKNAAKDYSIISLYNHGTNIQPNGSNFISYGYKIYKFWLVVFHDDSLYLYKHFTRGLFDKRVEKYKQKKYNSSEKEAHI